MKKNNVVEIVILGVLGALVVITLLIPQLLRDRENGSLLSVSVLFRDTDSSNWIITRQGMEQAADELGAELRFLNLTVQNDSREQEELLRREAEGGADALVAVPVDPESLYMALTRLSTSCPMVTLECAMESGAGAVAPDNRAVGQELARALLEDWSGGQVVLLDNSAACPEVESRLEAAQEVLSQAGISCVRLAALPEIWADKKWVMTFEPGATRQAADQKEDGYSFALYGVGSSTAITTSLEQGSIAAVAAWSDYAAGYLAVEQAVRAVRQRPQDLEPLTFSIVRGEDIYAPENQKLLFPVTS